MAKSRFDEPKLKMKEKIKASFISAKDQLAEAKERSENIRAAMEDL